MDKGIKKCMQLILEDGRKLENTLDHKILIFNNNKYIWKKAKDIEINKDKLVLGFNYPKINIDISENEQKWKLVCDSITLTYDTFENRIKTNTFVRLFGYIITNNSCYETFSNGGKNNSCPGFSCLKSTRLFTLATSS